MGDYGSEKVPEVVRQIAYIIFLDTVLVIDTNKAFSIAFANLGV